MYSDDKNYYQILGISPDATLAEIKRAYRSLARKYHPDVNANQKEYETIFKEISEAYSILSNTIQKDQYDQRMDYQDTKSSDIPKDKPKTQQKKNSTGPDITSSKHRSNTKKATPSSDKHVYPIPIQVMMTNFIHNCYQSLRRLIAGKNTKNQAGASAIQGLDVTVETDITDIEARQGTIKQITLIRKEKCHQCKGRMKYKQKTCMYCYGSGLLGKTTTIDVKIPPTEKNHLKLRIAGEGGKGLFGGKNGDLYVEVEVKNESGYIFEGLNVIQELAIDIYQAALGTRVDIKTLDGPVLLTIPPEMSSGQRLRVAGKGLKDQSTGFIGDHIVVLKIVTPKNLSQKEKNLFSELKKLRTTEDYQ